MKDSVKFREVLNSLLKEAQMKLRKWRSSSQGVLSTIPADLKEVEAALLPLAPVNHHKPLGIHWNMGGDIFHVSTPSTSITDQPTKHQLASDIARIYDIMGWFAPATLHAKILLQTLWKEKLSWDDQVPEQLADC